MLFHCAHTSSLCSCVSVWIISGQHYSEDSVHQAVAVIRTEEEGPSGTGHSSDSQNSSSTSLSVDSRGGTDSGPDGAVLGPVLSALSLRVPRGQNPQDPFEFKHVDLSAARPSWSTWCRNTEEQITGFPRASVQSSTQRVSVLATHKPTRPRLQDLPAQGGVPDDDGQ
ncbi:hypothetical protein WMY93_019180 [Mugilogobius chulae]|uniref:Uncharacterized protein n=1 Tax=Mugilogobius chulae TaxID=88201 RepID=A0AAW0NI07_9GOBI